MTGLRSGWPLVALEIKSYLETGKAIDIMAMKETKPA